MTLGSLIWMKIIPLAGLGVIVVITTGISRHGARHAQPDDRRQMTAKFTFQIPS